MYASRMNEVAAKAREKVYANTLSLVYQTIEGAAQGGHTNVNFTFRAPYDAIDVPQAVITRIIEELTNQGYNVKVMDGATYMRIDWTMAKA